jgi:large subunit ribosomal protein L4
VGEIRNPCGAKGGTVFGPQPRSYDYKLSKKVERGRSSRGALSQKLTDGQLVVVDELAADEI